MTGQTTAGRSPSHLRRALVFLAVVWSIGAGFLGLQALFLQLSDLSLAHVVPAKIGLPTQSAAGAARCKDVVKTLTPHENQGQASASRYRAWSMGFQFGYADEMANGASQDAGQVNKMMGAAQELARALGVPNVALPQGHRAYGIRDFTVSLEEDPQCVSAALAKRYSEQHASLYRFGAAVGLAMVYRMVVPRAEPLLEPQIRVYGQAGGVPAELWQPLLAERIAAEPNSTNHLNNQSNNQAAAVLAMVRRIDSYVKTLD
jgi:hypothetical protein